MQKLKNIFILSGFTILSGALNYATYPILIRYLSLEDFATFSVISSLVILFAIPAGGFGYFTLIRARTHPADIKEGYSIWMSKIRKYTLVYMMMVALIVVGISPYLGIHSPGAMILMVVCAG